LGLVEWPYRIGKGQADLATRIARSRCSSLLQMSPETDSALKRRE